MIRLSVAFSLSFLVGACTDKDQGDQPLGSTDVRVDHPASENDPDSGDTQMCVNDNGEIFVVWVDDRDGTPDIWFNRSLDLGVQWMPSDVKINRGFENNVWDPAIGCNNDGVFVAWEDDRDGELQNHQIYFSRSLDQGDTWSIDDLLLARRDRERVLCCRMATNIPTSHFIKDGATVGQCYGHSAPHTCHHQSQATGGGESLIKYHPMARQEGHVGATPGCRCK